MNNPFELIDARLSNIETLLLDIKHSPKDLARQPDGKQKKRKKEQTAEHNINSIHAQEVASHANL